MCKSSFNVVLNSHKTVILGVTSIMPNLNGVLFNTEDHFGVQVEHGEICDITITYQDTFDYFDVEDYKFLDHTL